MRGLQFVFCSNLRWHPENRNIFLATRIFAFLGQVKSGVDVGRDYGVTQWGDIMILACNSNRSQSLGKKERKSFRRLIKMESFFRRVPGLGTALTKAAINKPDKPGTNPIVRSTKYGNSCQKSNKTNVKTSYNNIILMIP